MKKKIYFVAGALVLALAAGISSCADLGFGVDVDSDGVSPYWYGNGYLGDYYWNTPVWNYGPIYNPVPPRPPQINNGIGPVRPPATVTPPNVPGNTFPGINRVPTSVGGIERPGNGGMTTPLKADPGSSIPLYGTGRNI